jgi:hypothetical protein
LSVENDDAYSKKRKRMIEDIELEEKPEGLSGLTSPYQAAKSSAQKPDGLSELNSIKV